MSMKIKKNKVGNFEILKVIGDATMDEIYKLSKAIDHVRTKGARHIAVDVSQTTSLDSSALGVLILGKKMLKKENREICILHPTEYIRELLFSANLDAVFRIVESEDQL